MRATSIEIINLRSIRSAKLELDSDLTVILGNNGTGKTTVLDALAFMLCQTLMAIKVVERGRPTWLGKNDITNGFDASQLKLGFRELRDQSQISSTVQTFERDKRPSFGFGKRPQNALLVDAAEGTTQQQAPLVVYYRQSRGFEAQRAGSEFQTATQILQASTEPDLGAIRNLQSWWDDLDADEGRTIRDTGNLKYRDPQLEAVRKLVVEIDAFDQISYHSKREPKGLYLRKSDGSSVHVDKLSSGERSYIVLLADLARRLQTIAPEKQLSEIYGIVLIDEVELNLHPAWQGKIIQTLRRVFRKCQFIITTHSPNVLSGIEAEHVRAMSVDQDGTTTFIQPHNTKGRTSNFLLEGVFGATERASDVDQLVYEFNAAIDRMELVKAEKLLSKLSNNIEGDAPELLVFRKRLERLKVKK